MWITPSIVDEHVHFSSDSECYNITLSVLIASNIVYSIRFNDRSFDVEQTAVLYGRIMQWKTFAVVLFMQYLIDQLYEKFCEKLLQ